MKHVRILLLGLLAMAALLVSVPQGHGAHINPTVVATVPAGDGLTSGIAVNPSADRVYVANNGSDTVSVIDGASNAVVATVAVGDGPSGVGVNPSTDRVYVANFSDNTASVIDGASNAVVVTVPVGDGPSGVGVNPTPTASMWATTWTTRSPSSTGPATPSSPPSPWAVFPVVLR